MFWFRRERRALRLRVQIQGVFGGRARHELAEMPVGRVPGAAAESCIYLWADGVRGRLSLGGAVRVR